MRRVHRVYVQSCCQASIPKNAGFLNGLNLFGGATFRRTTENGNHLQNIAKVSADFLRRGTNFTIICRRSPASFPACHCI